MRPNKKEYITTTIPCQVLFLFFCRLFLTSVVHYKKRKEVIKMRDKIIELFTTLIKYDTTSNPDSQDYPSTEAQFYYAEVLAAELMKIGMVDIEIDKYSYVTATLKGNCDSPTIGFISHMDTSPDCKGSEIEPIVIENYDGNIIERKGPSLDPNEFNSLKLYKGKTIICSDGTTLLGADDKAGITEIMTAMSYIKNHPEIKHGDIRVAFTPDEEIGSGVDYFDVEKFGCDYAYTIDGGIVGEISFENFNAARAKIDIIGKSVHPGSAKNLMINAGLIGCEFNSMLPTNETPATTENYEGFYHLTKIEGNVESAHLDYIIRDFDRSGFESRKNNIINIVETLNKKYGEGTVKLNLYDEYYNMAEIIEQNKFILDKAVRAIEKTGIEPKIEPIRGGTDGARLSYMGLPCPNIFTGGHNFHGPYEFICVESMEKAVETIVNIASV